MKVALIQAPGWGVSNPPLGLALLAAVLTKKGHSVEIFDVNREFYKRIRTAGRKMWNVENFQKWEDKSAVQKMVQRYSRFLERIACGITESGAGAAGFSVNSSSLLFSLELASRIRKKKAGIKIILGGYLCTRKRAPDSFLKTGDVDAVITGEGEKSFPDFLDYLKGKKKPGQLTGVIFRDKGRIADTGDRAGVCNMDRLPDPDFSIFPERLYGDTPFLPVVSSRGCIFNCVNCYLLPPWKDYRSMSGRRIFFMLRNLAEKTGIRRFFFYDPLINGNTDILANFCERMIRHCFLSGGKTGSALPDITWSATVVPHPELSEELLLKMKLAGCRYLYMGVVSGSQRVLDRLGRRFLIEDAERIIRDAFNAGIFMNVSFRVGFPSEEKEDFAKTLRFIKINRRYIRSISVPPPFDIPFRTHLAEHPGDFSIREPLHQTLWKTENGRNTYSDRLIRHERLCRFAAESGIRGAAEELARFLNSK